MTTTTDRFAERRLDPSNPSESLGHEVHVEGWGLEPFFTVRNVIDGVVHLSRRYSKTVRYRVPISRVYYTNPSLAAVKRKRATP